MKTIPKHIYKCIILFAIFTVACDNDDDEITKIPVTAASEIQILDLFNSGDASDIEVSFTRAQEENDLLEYRVIVVSTEDNNVLDVEVASKLESDLYQKVSTTGSDIQVRLDANLKTIAGESLQEEQFYILYVLSVSNGQQTNFNQLSTPSISFKISNKSDRARNLFLMDIGNDKNGSDLRISFSKARAEERVSLYRVFIVKSDKAADFTIEEAKRLRAIQYREVIINGEDHVVDIGSNFLDADRDAIVENQPYKALILSLEDGVNALNADLSRPSNELSLRNASFVKTLSEEFQGTGGLSYHPSGYLTTGNTSGFFSAESGNGTYRLSLDGTFELQNQNLVSCKGSAYHPGEGAILQGTKNGIFAILNDGSIRGFGGSGSVTDLGVLPSGSYYASYCNPPRLIRYDFSVFFGAYVPITIAFNNNGETISCMRYIELDGNGFPIILNYNDNKLYKIKKVSFDDPPEVHAELPFGENFTSIVYVDSRSSIYATTTQNRIIQIHEFKSTLTTLAGQGTSAIVDGDLESSSFINPVNITASTDGNTLYILDEVNKDVGMVVLRKIELVD